MTSPSLTTLPFAYWQPILVPTVISAAAALVYVAATLRARHWPFGRTLAFLAGLGAIVMALDSGLGRYGDAMLSAHMVQHMLLLLVAPALLLAGRPLILLLRTSSPATRRQIGSRLTRWGGRLTPLRCLVGFFALTVGTHLPGFYDTAVREPALHDLEHALFLLAGALLWWPLLGGDPVPAHRLGGIGRTLYLLAAMVPMALIGAYLNRHGTVVYGAYGPPARAVGISAVDDQQQAGAIMWVVGNTIMVLAGLWAIMSALVAEERRQRARDAHTPEPPAPASVPDLPGARP